jgi:hypothetical protein
VAGSRSSWRTVVTRARSGLPVGSTSVERDPTWPLGRDTLARSRPRVRIGPSDYFNANFQRIAVRVRPCLPGIFSIDLVLSVTPPRSWFWSIKIASAALFRAYGFTRSREPVADWLDTCEVCKVARTYVVDDLVNDHPTVRAGAVRSHVRVIRVGAVGSSRESRSLVDVGVVGIGGVTCPAVRASEVRFHRPERG